MKGKEDLKGMLRARRLEILVTNDDGDSEGLRALLEVAEGFGNSYALIPNRQRSAVATAVTLHKPIRTHRIAKDITSINGTPADCVLFSLHSGRMPRPDLVLSGINWGDNTGMGSVIGSGTIGACWQAVLEGVPAIAFSMQKRTMDPHEETAWGERAVLKDTVSKITESLIRRLDNESFFNVNMPKEVKDAYVVETQHLQRERYTTDISQREDPNGRPYYWINGKAKRIAEGSDTDLVLNKGKITVSRISLDMFGE